MSSHLPATITITVISIIFCLIVSSSSSVEAAAKPPRHPNAGITEIRSEEKFSEITQSDSRIALMYFYAGWCSTCKWFTKHEYTKIAKHFDQPGYHGHVAVSKIDGTNFPKLSKSLGIEGYPVIYLYSVDEIGKAEKYSGEMTADKLQAWVEERLHKRMDAGGHMIPPKKEKRGII